VGNFLLEEPHWFKMSYPYFWHPVKGMVKNGTIFMVVAVSAERYRAICHPLRKRQVRWTYEQGCQMVYFSDQKSQFGLILEGLGVENIGIFYDHMEYFTAICYNLHMTVWYSL
jgi:hypothetical protein